MDSRVATNAQRQKEDAAKLAALQVNTDKLAKVSDESKALFSCILTLSNWVELAMVRSKLFANEQLIHSQFL
jgi:hypothetical protein